MAAQITVLKTVYFRPADGQPTAYEARWTRPLASSEDPYVRTLTATTSWQALDVGWIKDAGLLIVLNVEGRVQHRRLAPEERQAAAARVLEIAVGSEPPWLVPPGESFVGQPADAKRLRIRCQSETAKYQVILIPA
jgi:hypothetical protein